MKKLMILLSVVFLLMSLVTITGCGGDNAAQDEAATEKEAIQVATHDCEGGCGMKDMPADKTTESDGEFFCAGCAAHPKSDDHEGHSH